MRRDTTEQTVSELQSMSVQQEAVELERNSAHLSTGVDGEAPWTIHGIAIGEGDVTRGQSGVRKKWPREALKPAADSLEGRPLVEDHDNSARGVVGEVIATSYKNGVGVLYEAELYDEELAERIKNGLLEVSIRGYHGDVEEMSETEEGAKLVQTVKFDNLSVVPSGAAPSNSAQMGPSTHLSAAECAAMMGAEPEEAPDVDDEAELADFSEGDYVQYGLMGSTVRGRIEDMEGQMAFLTLFWNDGDEWVNTEIPDSIPLGALDSWDREEAGRPEGAEEVGNPNKLEEEPERYPEEGDTPQDDRKGMHEYEEDEEASEEPDEGMDEAELAEYSFHKPDWDGETESEWSTPDFEEFRGPYNIDDDTSFSELDEEMRNAIAEHFLISAGGFPPENYGDLKLPVVEPNGELSRNALVAVKGGRGASAVEGLSDDMEENIISWVNSTASEVFDEDWSDEEENAEAESDTEEAEVEEEPADEADEPADAGDEVGEDDDTVTVLSADRSIPVVSDNDGTGNEPVRIVAENNTGDLTMTDEITEEELEELRRKATAYDELEAGDDDGTDPSEAVDELREEFQSDLEELKDRTALLDEVDRSDVESLQETDEPHIMEREKYEQLEEDVDTVRSLYAEALSKRTGVPAERIQDKWTLEEMREDLEDELDSDEELEGELTPDPQGADPEEEELEEAAEAEAGEDNSPSEEASEKQDEIRQRILS